MLPQIKAGTTGKAQATLYPVCMRCNAPETMGFGQFSTPAPGWNASFEDETVDVPPETPPGIYEGMINCISIRSTFTQMCPFSYASGPTAPCKHLEFEVIAADLPPDGPGPTTTSC